MKKTIIAICAAAAATIITTGAVFSSATVAEKKSVGSEKALEIALSDAGISRESVIKSSSEFDKEKGRYVFDVDFDCDGKEYDYTIDAKSGEIIERDVKNDDENSATAAKNETTPKTEGTEKSDAQTATQAAAQLISLNEAKSIALSDANVKSSNANFTKGKLDRDDGRYEYEIEFVSNGKEYEYTIDAKSGKILEKSVEAADEVATTRKNESSTSAFISVDKAKSIALNHAGLKASEVVIGKIKLEKDDGIYEYEVEFTKGNWEYEYSINAKTGKIIEWDKEYDD